VQLLPNCDDEVAPPLQTPDAALYVKALLAYPRRLYEQITS
jgi:hypothetical protein